MASQICFNGLAASFCTSVVLNNKKDSIPDSLNIIPLMLGDKKRSLTLSLIRHKDRYQTGYALFFSDLIYDYFSNIEHTPVAKLGGLI